MVTSITDLARTASDFGLRLEFNRASVAHRRYRIADAATGTVLVGAMVRSYDLTATEAEEWLTAPAALAVLRYLKRKWC